MVALPRMRNLNASPITVKGEQLLCLSDPAGYTDAQMILSPHAMLAATFLDGQNDIAEVQRRFAMVVDGVYLPEGNIEELVQALDEIGFLDTEHFERLREETEAAFKAQPQRVMQMAGDAYPEDGEAFSAWFDSRAESCSEGAPCFGQAIVGTKPPVRCLIAPHIDFERGIDGYVAAYSRLYMGSPPEVALLFGVAHCGAETPFVLTRKDFDTPFGVLKTDQALVSRLEEACTFDPYRSEFAHCHEHSLEFQAVMLGRLYGDKVRIVPVLCAIPERASAPTRNKAIAQFLTACNALAGELGSKLCVIAGADLAHVGGSFGDDVDITEELVETVCDQDLACLRLAMNNKANAFYAAVAEDGNPRHVCGLGCIYAAMKTVDGLVTPGELLTYSAAPDPQDGFVTFAAAAYVAR